MAPTAQPKYQPGKPNDKLALRRALPHETKRTRLKDELSRQRALLLTDWNLSLTPPVEQGPCADPADQVTSDLAQDLAMQVRMRMFEKLKRIEKALRLIQTKQYGRCRRCREAIPYERLAVQPDALFCVPCLAQVERKAG
jgi:DnaK suppressor protein